MPTGFINEFNQPSLEEESGFKIAIRFIRSSTRNSNLEQQQFRAAVV